MVALIKAMLMFSKSTVLNRNHQCLGEVNGRISCDETGIFYFLLGLLKLSKGRAFIEICLINMYATGAKM